MTQLLDCRDYCWNLCQAYALSLDNYVILLRHMKQIITESLALQTVFGAVVAQIEKILSGFNQDACKNMKALWQYFGPATLCSETLFNTEQRMLEVNASLDVYRAQRGEEKKRPSAFFLSFSLSKVGLHVCAFVVFF